MKRLGSLLAALILGLGVAAAPAQADDPLPTPLVPPEVTAPTAPGNDVPPGPTYVVTPGVGGSDLPAPATGLPSDPPASAGPTAPGDGTATAAATPTVAPTDDGAAVVGPAGQAPADEEGPGAPWPVVAGVLAAVLVATAAGWRVLIVRRRSAATPEAPPQA